MKNDSYVTKLGDPSPQDRQIEDNSKSESLSDDFPDFYRLGDNQVKTGQSLQTYEINENDVTFQSIHQERVRKKTAMRPIGHQWVLYVNSQALDWHSVCQNDFQVRHEDEITWKF